MIISQIVGIIEDCDQNCDRVSKNDKIFHICSMRLKSVLVRYEKYGTLSMSEGWRRFRWRQIRDSECMTILCVCVFVSFEGIGYL